MENMLHQNVYIIFARTYTALIVDYRLIFCILFVEHAFEIDKMATRGTNEENQHDLNRTQEEVEPIKITHQCFDDYQRVKWKLPFLGFLFGLLIVLLQILNILVYINVGPWANIMGCLAAWSFIIAGVCLLNEVCVKIIVKQLEKKVTG